MSFKTKIIKYLFLISILYSQISFGQVNYQTEKDSLLQIKITLDKEMLTLKAELDSLKNYLASFDEKLNLKKTELMVLRYGKKFGTQVASGQIWKGMTEWMLKDSWGEPDKIKKNVEKWGVFTQWSYGDITYFFRDGTLTDWEEKKK